MNPVRLRLHALVDALVDAIEAQAPTSDWVSQKASPLGRRRHLELARRGTLKSSKDGGLVLIRRADIERYLEKKTVIKVDEKADEDREVARVLAAHGRRAG